MRQVINSDNYFKVWKGYFTVCKTCFKVRQHSTQDSLWDSRIFKCNKMMIHCFQIYLDFVVKLFLESLMNIYFNVF